MDKPSRAEHTARIHAFLEDALDRLDDEHPGGYDLGIVALVYECLVEAPLSDYLKREKAGYTPDDDVHSYVGWWCSDHRRWVQRAFFEEALPVYRTPTSEPPDEEDSGED